MQGKLIIFSAPSGSGKTTIVKHLLDKGYNFEFSISACNRNPRGKEEHGKDYYFLSTEDFKANIDKDHFVEWEEVYDDRYYGTLKSELERIWANGNHVIFDVDVKGGVSLKKLFGDKALSVFIMPPSVDHLRERLVGRSTDSAEDIEQRIAKAEDEMAYAPQFDQVILNDDLAEAKQKAEEVMDTFLAK